MQTVTPQIPTSPRVELHLAVPYPTITTHLFQPPIYLHSLTFQRFTEVLPRQNPHYHYFPQPLLLQPLNHLLVLLHNLLRLIHTQIICSNMTITASSLSPLFSTSGTICSILPPGLHTVFSPTHCCSKFLPTYLTSESPSNSALSFLLLVAAFPCFCSFFS